MLTFGIFGAGRIGSLHARTLVGSLGAKVKWIYDPCSEVSETLAAEVKAASAPDGEIILQDPAVDAVIIASATQTHADLIEASVQANKAVFCEKPLDLDLKRASACVTSVRSAKPIMIGFNRRFDPGFLKVHTALNDGSLGDLELLSITSRDPAPPPLAYVKVSGGLFRDMMIHDFDMARWMLGEEPVSVFASASCLVDPAIGQEGDVDTAAVILRTGSGRICQINNSRRTTYGYDQRLEVHASKGMSQSETHWESRALPEDAPFFMRRYYAAYVAELDHFIDCVQRGVDPDVGLNDGLQALRLAEAAELSLRSGEAVLVPEFVAL